MRFLPRTALWALVVTSCCVSPALAAPAHLRLAFGEDSSRQVSIAWSTYEGTPEATVEYGKAPGVYGAPASGTMAADPLLGTISEVLLSNLDPDTTYYYRVGGSQGGWSEEASFRTGPPLHDTCATFRFAYFGDSRADEHLDEVLGASAVWPPLFQKALAWKPVVTLHGGDIIREGDNTDQWRHHLEVSAPMSKSMPIMYSLGNHDDEDAVQGDGANFNKIFALPRSSAALGGSGTEDYYYFEVGNAIFFAVSTTSFEQGAIPFAEQAAWLDKVLQQHANKRWKVLYMHHPIYTQEPPLSGHEPNEKGQNPAFVEVINRHRVDLVIGSHNHFYERWAPSRCADPSSTVVCPPPPGDPGTLFLTSGGAGAFLNIDNLGAGPREATFNAFHYLLAEVSPNELTLRAIDDLNLVRDVVTLKKDALSPDPCATATGDSGPVQSDAGATAPMDSSSPLQGDSANLDDVGVAGDQGAAPKESAGCNCNLLGAPESGAGLAWFLLLAAGALLSRRRKR